MKNKAKKLNSVKPNVEEDIRFNSYSNFDPDSGRREIQEGWDAARDNLPPDVNPYSIKFSKKNTKIKSTGQTIVKYGLTQPSNMDSHWYWNYGYNLYTKMFRPMYEHVEVFNYDIYIDKKRIHPCKCQCYNCINGAHEICDCKPRCPKKNSKHLGLTILFK